MSSFNDFPLQPATRASLATMEITEPTPIQAQAIPALLAGKDLVGQSATGSGKTLSYIIPIVERLARDKRVTQALILVPTRELAIQVNTVLSTLATSRRFATALLVGGRAYGSQLSALRYGAQIVVGTPGRVKDHLDRGTLKLSHLRMCILDEADQMLDSGFGPVIEEILATTPDTRQMALFSATIPDWVAQLEKQFLQEPVKITITPAQGAPSAIEQIAYQVPQAQKMAALCTLLQSTQGESTLIFGRTKYGVEKLGKQLSKLGFTVGTLHGDKSQRAREEVLGAFRRGQVQTLLATNVAARGLDIQGLYQVINYELPESSDLFTHRIGRTGRMGQQGKAITLLVPADVPKWRRMARSLGQAVSLQQLALDEEVRAACATPRPEASSAPEQESSEPYQVRSRKQASPKQKKHSERQLIHERRQVSPEQEQGDERQSRRDGKRISPERKREKQTAADYDGYAQSRTKERSPRTKERIPHAASSGASTQRSKERPFSEEYLSTAREVNGRRGAGRQSRSEKSGERRTVSAFPASQQLTTRARRSSGRRVAGR